MKVYELINKLAEIPAGSDVRIHMCKELSEIPKNSYDSCRIIDFAVQEVDYTNNTVTLDGWDG